MTDPTLATATEGILAAVGTLLQAEIAEDKPLEAVVTLTRGGRDKPKPPTPALLYWPEAARPYPDLTSLRQRSVWGLTVNLAAVVISDDPAAASTQATVLTSEARAILLKSQSLGLGYVKGVRDLKFEPNGPVHREGPAFGALAIVEVLFIAQY